MTLGWLIIPFYGFWGWRKSFHHFPLLRPSGSHWAKKSGRPCQGMTEKRRIQMFDIQASKLSTWINKIHPFRNKIKKKPTFPFSTKGWSRLLNRPHQTKASLNLEYKRRSIPISISYASPTSNSFLYRKARDPFLEYEYQEKTCNAFMSDIRFLNPQLQPHIPNFLVLLGEKTIKIPFPSVSFPHFLSGTSGESNIRAPHLKFQDIK